MNRTAPHQPPTRSKVPPSRTDTVRLVAVDGQLVDTTMAIPFPWMLPPVTRAYRTPRARLARRWAMVRYSPAAAHLRASADAAYWTGVVLAGILLAVLVAYGTRGHYLGAHGWQPIPTTGQHSTATGGTYR